jgi:hypothetical protein
MVHRCGVLVEKRPPDLRGVARGQFADIGGIVEMPTQGPAMADALQAGPDQDVDVLGVHDESAHGGSPFGVW